jgi:hypothetical protein
MSDDVSGYERPCRRRDDIPPGGGCGIAERGSNLAATPRLMAAPSLYGLRIAL